MCNSTHTYTYLYFVSPAQLLKVDHPSLLDSQRCVEVCVPLTLSGSGMTEETSDPSDLELSNDPPPTMLPISDSSHSTNDATASNHQPTANQQTTGETPSLSKHGSDQSWEVLSKHSTTSTRLTMRQDGSSPDHQLIPLWECLQVQSLALKL